MGKASEYLLTLIIFLFTVSCDKTPDNPPIINPPDTAYGIRFENVPALQDIVMYEVNLRAFSPSGDLQGVIDRLDEIKALGTNVIWLMPIHPDGEINSVNSPYSVRDYKAIGPEYGGLADLRKLTDEAHKLDIAVIMDWVANHTSWDNAWISHKDWYTQDSEGNIISPPEQNWADVANLNYDNMEMQNAMIAAMKYWVWKANIDGFRCDYADGIPYSFWKRAIDTLKSMPDRDYVLLAEGSRADHFTAGFDMIYAWDFYYRMRNVFEGQDANGLYTVHLSEENKVPDNKQILRYSTNHDQSAWENTPMVFFNGKKGALAASVATIFMGGAPLFYTGQEVGTVNKVPFFSNSAINWNDNPDMFLEYQSVMAFYTGSDAARRGSNTNFSNTDVICFMKEYESEKLLLIINVRDAGIEFTLPQAIDMNGWTNAMTNESFGLEQIISLENYQYFILKK